MPAGDMDSAYSVGVKNRFIGIDSDIIDDPLELIRQAQEKPKKDKDKPKPKKDVKPVKDSKATKTSENEAVVEGNYDLYSLV